MFGRIKIQTAVKMLICATSDGYPASNGHAQHIAIQSPDHPDRCLSHLS